MSKKKSWQKIDPSNSTITNFFQSQKKTTLIEPLQNKTDGFYDDFSANQCTSECLKQKRDLKRILESETEKLNDLKQALSTCLKICEKKELKIVDLQKQIGPSQSVEKEIATSQSVKKGSKFKCTLP